MTPTILGHHGSQLKTLAPVHPLGYSEGCVLTVWSDRGRCAITLDRAELQALLRELPSALLLEAIAEGDVYEERRRVSTPPYEER